MGHAAAGGGVGLVYVYAVHGAPEESGVTGVFWGATDCVVEDEDLGGACTLG